MPSIFPSGKAALGISALSIAFGNREDDVERRREGRLSMHLAGSYVSAAKCDRHVCISHLSANDCRLADEDTPLVVGETICLALGAVETLGATVIWTKQNTVGVRFGAPLDDITLSIFSAYCRCVA
jgi:hypothetical protein